MKRTALALATLILTVAVMAGFVTSGVFLWRGDTKHWAVFQVLSLCLFAVLLVLANFANRTADRRSLDR